MYAKSIDVFRCAECGKVFLSYDYAAECCMWPPKIEIGYACSVCYDPFLTKIEADLCCSAELTEQNKTIK